MSPSAHTFGAVVRCSRSTTSRPSSWHSQPPGAGVEEVGVRAPPHGEQDDLGLDVARAGGAGEPDPPRVADLLGRGRQGRQAQVVAAPREVGVPLGDLDLLVPQQRRAALHLGHRHPQGGEHVRQLAGDVAAAEDRHPRREPVEPHDGVRGVQTPLGIGGAQAVDVEPEGPAPGGDDDPVGRELLAGG